MARMYDGSGRLYPQYQAPQSTYDGGGLDFRKLYARSAKPDPRDFMRTGHSHGMAMSPAGLELDRVAYQQALNQWEQGSYYDALDNMSGYMGDLNAKTESLMGDVLASNKSLGGEIQSEIEFNRRMRDQFEELYAPLREDYIKASREGVQADYSGAMSRAEGELTDQFERARTENQREMSRYGVNPTDGRFVSSSRAMQLAEAAAKASARTGAWRSERDRVDNTNWSRMHSAMGTAPSPGQFSNTGLMAAKASLNNSTMGVVDRYSQAAAGVGELMGRYAAENRPGAHRVTRNSSGQIVG